MRLTARIALTAVLLAVLATGATSAPVPADRAKADKEFAAVAAKVLGSWDGGPCEGAITFRADRTYEWTGRGPDNESDTGVWTLRGDPAEPTLVMECKKSDSPARAAKTTEVKVASVDDERLLLQHPNFAKPHYWGKKDPNDP